MPGSSDPSSMYTGLSRDKRNQLKSHDVYFDYHSLNIRIPTHLGLRPQMSSIGDRIDSGGVDGKSILPVLPDEILAQILLYADWSDFFSIQRVNQLGYETATASIYNTVVLDSDQAWTGIFAQALRHRESNLEVSRPERATTPFHSVRELIVETGPPKTDKSGYWSILSTTLMRSIDSEGMVGTDRPSDCQTPFTFTRLQEIIIEDGGDLKELIEMFCRPSTLQPRLHLFSPTGIYSPSWSNLPDNMVIRDFSEIKITWLTTEWLVNPKIDPVIPLILDVSPINLYWEDRWIIFDELRSILSASNFSPIRAWIRLIISAGSVPPWRSRDDMLRRQNDSSFSASGYWIEEIKACCYRELQNEKMNADDRKTSEENLEAWFDAGKLQVEIAPRLGTCHHCSMSLLLLRQSKSEG